MAFHEIFRRSCIRVQTFWDGCLGTRAATFQRPEPGFKWYAAVRNIGRVFWLNTSSVHAAVWMSALVIDTGGICLWTDLARSLQCGWVCRKEAAFVSGWTCMPDRKVKSALSSLEARILRCIRMYIYFTSLCIEPWSNWRLAYVQRICNINA